MANFSGTADLIDAARHQISDSARPEPTEAAAILTLKSRAWLGRKVWALLVGEVRRTSLPRRWLKKVRKLVKEPTTRERLAGHVTVTGPRSRDARRQVPANSMHHPRFQPDL
jgi:hypothetical protein